MITVDSLGVYNAHWDTGLAESHSISMYAMTDSSGNALMNPTLVGNTVTVPSGTSSDGSDGPYVDENSTNEGFRYQNLTAPVQLTQGVTYAVVVSNFGGADEYGNPAVSSNAVGPGLTLVGENFSSTAGHRPDTILVVQISARPLSATTSALPAPRPNRPASRCLALLAWAHSAAVEAAN